MSGEMEKERDHGSMPIASNTGLNHRSRNHVKFRKWPSTFFRVERQ